MSFKIDAGQGWRRAVLATLTVALLPTLWASDTDAQTAKTTTYTYDALGRLTFVEDGQNGNRDYDYDKAGNRLSVAIGIADDAASNPPAPVPAAPGGRSKSYVANCAWRAIWSRSTGAASYTFKNTLNQSTTIYPVTGAGSGYSVNVTSTTITVDVTCPINNPQANEPGTVRACNVDGCSDYVAF